MKSFFSFVALLIFSTSVFASRIDQMNQLFTDYNVRFVAGKYVSNSNQIRSFNLQQDALATDFKKSGGLQQVLLLTNDFDKSLSVKLYLLLDENNALFGVYYEKSSYYDEEERSYLRFKALNQLEAGLGFVSVNGTYALKVKGFYFKPNESATLQFAYLTDLKKNSVGSINLFILNRNNSWAIYNESYGIITQADVKTWSSFFPPNGGVKQIILR
jgi:hypothetical protein